METIGIFLSGIQIGNFVFCLTMQLTLANAIIHEDARFSRRIDKDRSCLCAGEISLERIKASLSRQAMQGAALRRPIIHQKIGGLFDRRYGPPGIFYRSGKLPDME